MESRKEKQWKEDKGRFHTALTPPHTDLGIDQRLGHQEAVWGLDSRGKVLSRRDREVEQGRRHQHVREALPPSSLGVCSGGSRNAPPLGKGRVRLAPSFQPPASSSVREDREASSGRRGKQAKAGCGGREDISYPGLGPRAFAKEVPPGRRAGREVGGGGAANGSSEAARGRDGPSPGASPTQAAPQSQAPEPAASRPTSSAAGASTPSLAPLPASAFGPHKPRPCRSRAEAAPPSPPHSRAAPPQAFEFCFPASNPAKAPVKSGGRRGTDELA
ncbi:uncharacterized protein LOC113219726 [Piliocolobus tephrosceles]|uniref:uncharacterized protein LOC113219726 n=1 Tax=Piliocolobus tephrosceles TaxID=591936 RepID=UPI000E6AF1BF|nr:uncharacterized protein LOC113219726 [Piliocolobus tephrosceles]